MCWRRLAKLQAALLRKGEPLCAGRHRFRAPGRGTLRHMHTAPVPVSVRGRVFAFDGFELDIPGFELRRQGSPVPLEPQVFEVLAFLVENAGRALSKQELLDHVWPERYVTEAALNSRVMAARKALGDNGQAQRYIKTVHGRGYRFFGTLEEQPLPAAPAGAVPARLPARLPFPAPATPFIGREADLQRLMDLLEGDARLLTIVGAGGMGKTRLASELAARLAAAGRPVAFTALETSTATTFAADIAAATGYKPRTTGVAAEVVQHLAGLELVLVLDNLEHVIEPARGFLQGLLAAAPSVRVVATSRAVVGLRQEWVYRATGLAVESAAGETPEAVRLFIERARQAQASAGVSADELDAVTRICRQVDGMPLAIELAAALTRYVGAAEVAALVQSDVSALEVDLPDTPARHQSITALMEESLRHLGDREREVLRALAVFEGGFTSDAACAVAGASLPVLRSLADRSLLQCAGGRFALHPLMRQFLCCQAASRDGLQEAHATYYGRFLAARTGALESDGQVAATAAIDAEFANVLAAWRWACTHGRTGLIDEARYPLFAYLTFRGRFFEAHEIGGMAIQALEAAGDPGKPILAALLTHYVWTLFRIGRPGEAVAMIARAQRLFAESGAEPGPGMGTDPLTVVAALRLGAGQYSEAYAAASAALSRAHARDDRIGVAFASWLAGCARLREANLEVTADAAGHHVYLPAADAAASGHLEEAMRLTGQAAMILEAAGETWLRGFVEIERGLAACANGDRAGAIEHQRRAYLLRKQLNDPQGMGSALVYLADTMSGLGQYGDARAMQAEARRYFHATGDATGLTEVDRSEGMLERATGNEEAAIERLLASLRASVSLAFTNNVLSVARGLALILADWGEYETALRALGYVAIHPSTTPFSRALARRDLAEVMRRSALPAPGDLPALDAIGLAALASELDGAIRRGPGRSREYACAVAGALAHAHAAA